MDKKVKNSIINCLRRLSYTNNPERHSAKKKRIVGPATYKCDFCSIFVYEGKKSLEEISAKYTPINVIKGKLEMDHKIPVINPNTGWTGFDAYIESVWCKEENYNGLCKDCHGKKTQTENAQRRKTALKMPKKDSK